VFTATSKGKATTAAATRNTWDRRGQRCAKPGFGGESLTFGFVDVADVVQELWELTDWPSLVLELGWVEKMLRPPVDSMLAVSFLSFGPAAPKVVRPPR
jgi:hypothetical protein